MSDVNITKEIKHVLLLNTIPVKQGIEDPWKRREVEHNKMALSQKGIPEPNTYIYEHDKKQQQNNAMRLL